MYDGRRRRTKRLGPTTACRHFTSRSGNKQHHVRRILGPKMTHTDCNLLRDAMWEEWGAWERANKRSTTIFRPNATMHYTNTMHCNCCYGKGERWGVGGSWCSETLGGTLCPPKRVSQVTEMCRTTPGRSQTCEFSRIPLSIITHMTLNVSHT